MSFLDLPKVRLVERMMLKKFDGPIQTNEHLLEVCIIEDGVVIDYWCRDDQPEAQKVPPSAKGGIILNPTRREDG